ncbi:50S ribosomal protein L3 [Pseudomonadota bacterium]
MLGLVGKKIGMSRLYNEDGAVLPVTLVQMYDCCISDYVSNESEDFALVTVAFDIPKKANKVAKPQRVAFEKRGLSPYKKMVTFKVAKDQEYKLGDKITIGRISVGDFFDVQGKSKGKGFAGAMKRHNFSGLEATHGVSISHRSLGGTGNLTKEGRVFKGKKMAGHMGDKRVTVKNLEVLEVYPEDNLICIKGSIPGAKSGDVILKPSNL